MKKLLIGLLILVAIIAAIGLYFYWQASTLQSQRITDDVHMISGLGGNVTVIKTGEGAVVVDSMTFKFQGDNIRELAEELAGESVKTIINTHYHLDHTHGNPAFPADTQVIATTKTAEYLKRCDADYFEGANGFPNKLVESETDLKIGSKTLRILTPGRGHTGGDLAVFVVEDDVLVAGDLYFNRHYPNIDIEADASVELWPDALDYLALIGAKHVIPGHGEPSDEAGMSQFRDFMIELGTAAKANADKTLDEASAAIELITDEGYETIGVPLIFILDRDFVVKRAWEEASETVKPGGCSN